MSTSVSANAIKIGGGAIQMIWEHLGSLFVNSIAFLFCGTTSGEITHCGFRCIENRDGKIHRFASMQ